MSKPGIILDPGDIRELIAKEYGVKVENVIKIQYSYIVVKNADKTDCEE